MNIDIAYTISNEYAHCLSVSIASILKNTKETDNFNFYVLNSDLSDENKRKIEKIKKIKDFNIEYIQMNNDDFNNMSEGISIVSNYRLKIASLKPQLDKILFLDSDVIITNSLEELWNTDLEDNYIAAVVDPGTKLQYEYTLADKELFPDRRFNTGVILANLKKWRDDDVENKILEGMVWYSQKYFSWPDQNIMNMVFKNKIIELSPRYNCCPILAQQNLYQEEGVWEKASDNPIIIHFCGIPKYWEERGLWWNDIFWDYAKLTPYYEDFLMNYTSYKINQTNEIISARISHDINYVLNFLSYYSLNIFKIIKLQFNYICAKILAKFSTNEKKEQYLNKRKYFKSQLQSLKQICIRR